VQWRVPPLKSIDGGASEGQQDGEEHKTATEVRSYICVTGMSRMLMVPIMNTSQILPPITGLS
jgi:hypothetical protein